MIIQSDSALKTEAEELSIIEETDYDKVLEILTKRREIRKNSLYIKEHGDFIYGLIKHSEDGSYSKNLAVHQVGMAVSPGVLIPL